MKRININKIKLTKYEQSIENAIERGKYQPVSRAEFLKFKRAFEHARKSTVIHLRVNNNDLSLIKRKAKKQGLRYPALINNILHRIAHT